MSGSLPPLLTSPLAPEPFVRASLAALESEFRAMVLRALAEWEATGVVSPDLYAAVASLQRPSWGAWNGLLSALRTARKNTLRSGTPGERDRVERSPSLGNAVEMLDRPVPAGWGERLQPLAAIAGASLRSKPRFGQVLALPIALRNRVAHDAPVDEAWWGRTAEALRALLVFHVEHRPCSPPLGAAEHPEPWFLGEGAEVAAFQGLTEDDRVVYVGPTGVSRFSADRTQAVLLSFQRLLGKTEQREQDFRRLLAKAAPEEFQGLLMGEYLVGRPVGQGGFATVHVGRQLTTGRKVAIKILRDGMEEDARQRFQAEAKYLSQFNHPNVVGVIGYGEETWSLPRALAASEEPWILEFRRSAPVKTYIALEWVEGESLEDVFRKEAPRRPGTRILVDWMEQAAHALAAVHAANLIHRDVKPSNLMVTSDGRVKLMDFGVARTQGEARTLVTQADLAPGTPAYMAPEQLLAADAEAVGPSCDVYALAATFYELFTGTRLFEHDRRSMEVVKTDKVSGRMPTPPRALRPDLPWEVEAILLGGLRLEVADRYPSMEALERDLRHVLRDEPIEYRRPSLRRRAALAWRRNRRVANLSAAFALVAIAGAGKYLADLTSEQAATLLEKRRTEEQRDRAEANGRQMQRNLAAAYASQARSADSPYEGVLLAAKSLELDDRADARGALIRNLMTLPETVWAQAPADVGARTAAYSPDGEWVAAGGFDYAILVWRARDGRVVRRLAGSGGYRSLAFSPDGATLLSVDGNGAARLWDWRAARGLGRLGEKEHLATTALFSADGTRVFAGGPDGGVRVFDAASRALVEAWAGHGGPVEALALDPSGARLASLDAEGSCRVRDARDGATQWTGALGAAGQCLAFDGSGQRLAAGGAGGALLVAKAATGEVVLRRARGDEADLLGVVFLAGEDRLVTAGSDGRIRVLHARDGAPAERFEPAAGSPLRIAASPDGKHLFAVQDGAYRLLAVSPLREVARYLSAEHLPGRGLGVQASADGSRVVALCEGGGILVLDGADGRLLRTIPGRGAQSSALALSPDGALVHQPGDDGILRTWSAASGDLLDARPLGLGGDPRVARAADAPLVAAGDASGVLVLAQTDGERRVTRLPGGGAALRALAFSAGPDPVLAAADAGGTVRLYDAGRGVPLRTLEAGEQVWAVGFLGAGREARVLAAGVGKGIRSWPVAGSAPAPEVHAPAVGFVNALAVAPGGRRVALGSVTGEVHVLDAQDFSPIAVLRGHSDSVTSVAFAGGEGEVVSASHDRTVRRWRIARRVPELLPDRTIGTLALEVSPDGRLVASGSMPPRITLWDWATGRAVDGWTCPGGMVVAALAWHPDGTRIASAAPQDGRVRVWDVRTHQQVAEVGSFDAKDNLATAVLFAAGGRILLTGSTDKVVRAWDTTTWQLRGESPDHFDKVLRLLPHPDGKHVLVCSRTVRTLDPETMTVVAEFARPKWTATAAVSPDGTLAACGGEGGSLVLWDPRTGEEVGEVAGHAKDLTTVAFLPGGSHLVSTGLDGTIAVWDVAEPRQSVPEVLRLKGSRGMLAPLAIVDGGRTLLTAGYERPIRVWDLSSLFWSRQEVFGRALDLTGHWLHESVVTPQGTSRMDGTSGGAR